MQPQTPTHSAPPLAYQINVPGDWDAVFENAAKSQLEAALPPYLRQQRWFAGKARGIHATQILDTIRISDAPATATHRLVIVRVDYVAGESDTYLLPVVFATGRQAASILEDSPTAAIATLNLAETATNGWLCDATTERDFWLPLLDAIANGASCAGRRGRLLTFQTSAFGRLRGDQRETLEPAVLGREQSNTSAVFGERLILKLFRRLCTGTNPDLEIGRFLTETSPVASVPALAGGLEYATGTDEPSTLAVLQEFRCNRGDAWVFSLAALGRYCQRVTSETSDLRLEAQSLPRESLLRLADRALPQLALDLIGNYLQSAQLLGRRTAELHTALASHTDVAGFEPETFSMLDKRRVYEAMHTQTVRTFELLRKQLPNLPDAVQSDARRALEHEADMLGRLRSLLDLKLTALRVRCHGDYHLGQVLFTGDDFVIIDFEGEPDRPVSERRTKVSPLRDVAGMLRSFHYASHAARMGLVPGLVREGEASPTTDRWLRFWYVWSSVSFLNGYLSAAETAGFLPKNRHELQVLLDAYMLEKAVYELSYELNNRPDWVGIPLQGIFQLTESE